MPSGKGHAGWPPRGIVFPSYFAKSGKTSAEPCPWCRRTGFEIEFWMMRLGKDMGACNVCGPCGQARMDMQKLEELVDGSE